MTPARDDTSRAIENPVIPGFYPDPSICRVGSDYFLVTSSFEYLPGVPIFHSPDLVNFRQLGHCLVRDSQLDLRKAKSAQGTWAPTLRYHAGTFYMVTTNRLVANFYVTARDPAGPWSEPIFYDHTGYDPSIFFDDDGTAYFTNTSDEGKIVQSTFEPKSGKRTSEIRELWAGTGGPYAEAPHLYRRNGYYYLLLAEGGTGYEHRVTLARSRSPWGPFEACPHNPLLAHRDRVDHPFQCAGHADLVEAEDGSWWAVCLGVRPIHRWMRYHHLGRETFVVPVTWGDDDWPHIGEAGLIPEAISGPRLLNGQSPHVAYSLAVKPGRPAGTDASDERYAGPVRDDFDAPELGLAWNYRKNPARERYSLSERSGSLRLRGAPLGLDDEEGSPTFVGRRQRHFDCRAATVVDFEPASDGEEAGLTVLMNPSHHYEVFVSRKKGERFVQARRRVDDLSVTSEPLPLPAGAVKLEIRASAQRFRLGFVTADDGFHELLTGHSRFLSSEIAGGFMGVYLAMYAAGNGRAESAPAYFDWFEYEPTG
jgi:xylan 1,4-beta-xylosidase